MRLKLLLPSARVSSRDLIHLSLQIVHVVFLVSLMLGHISNEPHHLHLTFKFSDSLRTVQVTLTVSSHGCTSEHSRLIELLVKDFPQFSLNRAEGLILRVTLPLQLLVLL